MRVRIRRFDKLVPPKNWQAEPSPFGTPCGFHFSGQQPLRLHRAVPTQGPPKRDGSCTTLIETPALLTLPIVRAFAALATTTPSADFCCMVSAPYDALSHDSVTNSRSPEISSTACDTRPPDLPPAPLMDMGFAIAGSLARHRRPPPPVLVHRPVSLLHASFRPHLAVTPLRFASPSPPSGWDGTLTRSCRTCSAYQAKGPDFDRGLRESNLNLEI